MAHIHTVIDSDVHYKIDKITRDVANTFEIKKALVQHDHNSERITFEMPRYIDGHDIMECNRREILFINADMVEKDKKSGKMVLAETLCSDAARKRLDLKWEVWAERFNKYLNYIQSLINPDLIILGGGISSKPEKFFDYLDVKCDLVLASLENRAGIAGAAFEAGKRIS